MIHNFDAKQKEMANEQCFIYDSITAVRTDISKFRNEID